METAVIGTTVYYGKVLFSVTFKLFSRSCLF